MGDFEDLALISGYDDFEGVDIGEDLDDVGISPMAYARRFAQARQRGGRRGGGRKQSMQRYMAPNRVAVRRTPPIVSAQPGVSVPSIKYVPFGLGITSMGPGITTATLTQQPQLPIKPRKLTISVARNGAGVANAIILITAFNIGVNNQFAGLGQVDVAMFAANAEGVTMDLGSAEPGINVTLNFFSSIAPAALESIDISATFLVQAVG